MQDKDFDRLFRDRFEAFEVEPSKRSWQNISKTLDGPAQKRKAFPPYWMAAASVVVLVSMFLWLDKPVEVIKLRGKPHQELAKIKGNKPDNNQQLVQKEIITESAAAKIIRTGRSEKANLLSSRKVDKAKAGQLNKQIPQKLKTEDPRESQVKFARQEVNLPAKNNPFNVEEKPVAIAHLDENDAENYTEAETKPRIKSIGGLVNFVVAQVDKRENKIIEFKDGDEGSEVSGINLGFVKFKNRNK